MMPGTSTRQRIESVISGARIRMIQSFEIEIETMWIAMKSMEIASSFSIDASVWSISN